MRSLISILATFALIFIIVSCGDKGVPPGDDPPFITYQLELVSGNNQVGQANSFLPDSLTVRVFDNLGDPVSGDSVLFTQITPKDSAEFLPEPWSTTDDDGIAVGWYRLDVEVAVDTIKVVSNIVGDTGAVFFSVTVTPGKAAYIEKISPLNIPTTTAGEPLLEPVIVRLTDLYGNPTGDGKAYFKTANRSIVSTDSSAQHPFETDSAFTVGDADGLATAIWTLSVNPGPAYPAIHQLTAFVVYDDTLADTVDFGAWAADPGSLEYYYDVRPIFDDNCFQCHGPAADTGYRLDFYYQLLRDGNVNPGDTNSPLIADVNPFNHFGNINTVEEDKVIRWVVSDSAAPGSSGLNNYNDHMKSIIDASCISCHGGAMPENNYDMTTHLGIRGSGMDAVPNAIPGADSSLLVAKMEERHNWSYLDPDPDTAAALADSIIIWIVDDFIREF